MILSRATCTRCYVDGVVDIDSDEVAEIFKFVRTTMKEKVAVSTDYYADGNMYCYDDSGCRFDLTLIYEKTKFQDEVGYFVMDKDGNIKEEKIIFPRAKITEDEDVNDCLYKLKYKQRGHSKGHWTIQKWRRCWFVDWS